jgi:thymidylate synthase (FAD)
MRILKGEQSYVIQTSVEQLRDSLHHIERAGRTCYQSEKGAITNQSAEKFVRMIIKNGHESVLEHSSLTVKFFNVSRGFTHEMVRHRLSAFSQESTRYVDYAKDSGKLDLDRFETLFILPPNCDENERVEIEDGREMSAAEMLADYEKFYRALRRAGWYPEDARQLLPIGLKAELVVTANFRQWRHIFELRTNQRAHWEIRYVLGNLLTELKNLVPVIFEDFVEDGKDKKGISYFKKVKYNAREEKLAQVVNEFVDRVKKELPDIYQEKSAQIEKKDEKPVEARKEKPKKEEKKKDSTLSWLK